jgi:alkylhydroperoxidase family enzyme
MDERTPHMHLTFCPITPDKRLSAKKILGNPAQLSQWQTDYHAYMSQQWPELERGISAQITKRKHIPVWLFKSAERLDKQFADVSAALEGINPMNAKKKRDSAMRVLERWMPEAVKFTARLSDYGDYIKTLERSESELTQRVQSAEQYTEHCVGAAVASVQHQLDGKDEEILAARREAYQAAEKLRKQANHIDHIVGRLPLDMRKVFYEQQAIVLAMGKEQKGRGKSR